MLKLHPATLAVAAALASQLAVATTTKPTPAPVPTPAKLWSGGATNSAIAYVGSDWLLPDSAGFASRLSSSDGTGPNDLPANSLFGNYVASGTAKKPVPAVSYCQNGSTAGLNLILGTAGYDPTIACGDLSTATNPKGVGAPAGTTEVNFTGADYPLQQADYAAFSTNGRATTNGEPVQIPTVAGSIAVIYNPGASGATGQLILTESQVCQIFSGQITNWSQLGNYASQPIQLVLRGDNAATNYNFLNHETAVCPTAVPVAVAGVFSTTGKIVNGDTALQPVGGNPSPLFTASDLTSTSNGAVVTKVLATAGSFGVAQVADAVARASQTGGTGLYYAAIKQQQDIPATIKYVPTATNTAVCNPATGPKSATCNAVKVAAQKFKAFDPVLDFPKAIKVNATSDVVAGPNTSNGHAQLVTLTSLSVTPVKAGCLQIVDPNTYAIPALAKGDYSYYPIASVGYFLAFEKGNGAQAPYIAALLSQQFKIGSKVKTIGAKTGFAALTVTQDSNAAGATPAKTVAACINT